jgi:hypothetical protein
MRHHGICQVTACGTTSTTPATSTTPRPCAAHSLTRTAAPKCEQHAEPEHAEPGNACNSRKHPPHIRASAHLQYTLPYRRSVSPRAGTSSSQPLNEHTFLTEHAHKSSQRLPPHMCTCIASAPATIALQHCHHGHSAPIEGCGTPMHGHGAPMHGHGAPMQGLAR